MDVQSRMDSGVIVRVPFTLEYQGRIPSQLSIVEHSLHSASRHSHSSSYTVKATLLNLVSWWMHSVPYNAIFCIAKCHVFEIFRCWSSVGANPADDRIPNCSWRNLGRFFPVKYGNVLMIPVTFLMLSVHFGDVDIPVHNLFDLHNCLAHWEYWAKEALPAATVVRQIMQALCC